MLWFTLSGMYSHKGFLTKFRKIPAQKLNYWKNAYDSELEELFVKPVEVPNHLKKLIPDYMKYQQCADAFVMALVYQGAWNRWYKNEFASNNEPVPAMIICLGKEFKKN